LDDKEQLKVEERGADVRTFLIADVRDYTRFTHRASASAAEWPGRRRTGRAADERSGRAVVEATPGTGAYAIESYEPDRRSVLTRDPLTNERGIDLISERVGNYQRNLQLGMLLDQLCIE
jgi:hypothetical protein